MKRLICTILIMMLGVSLFASEVDKFHFAGRVVNAEDGVCLSYATIEVTASGGESVVRMSDENGEFSFYLSKVSCNIVVTSVGFKEYRGEFAPQDKQLAVIKLHPAPMKVGDVMVTASEKKGMTSTSVINRKAMEHLQPSSIGDLLELLPGGSFKFPTMGKANFAALRQAGTLGSNYDISSLGTSFVVDGVPLSVDASLQTIRSGVTANDNRDITSRGVDMRGISTDNIESVEVIRGIPSVEYGDLTSGVVKINRREGRSALQGRFKADQFSKLFAVGKGFGDNRNVLNVSFDYLDSKIDPRDSYENYKRMTASARYVMKRDFANSSLEFRSVLDYSGSFDNKKSDPDVDESNDKFRSAYNRTSFNNSVKLLSSRDGLFRTLELRTSISLQADELTQTRAIYLTTPSFIPNSMVAGEHDGVYLPNSYTSELTIDGRPLSAFVLLNAGFGFRGLGMQHRLNIGLEYRADKNLGEGQIYDPTRPPSSSMTGRARAYNEIPALQKASAFVEDKLTADIDGHLLSLLAGVRATMLVGMSSRYALSNKVIADPRLNLSWQLPDVSLGDRKLRINIGGGYGVHSKTPTLAHLYPELNYYDLESMNYFHNNSDYRRLFLTTHIIDPTNYGLMVARNYKWELRGDLSFEGNSLSLTYFRERSGSGFRPVAASLNLSYKRYDTSGIDHNEITARPDPSALPYTTETLLSTYSRTENGSTLNKEGVEFQFSSKRISVINTRVTVNGAWFRTLYTDSYEMLYSNSVIVDGKRLPYLGIYDLNDGARREQFNTNIMFDTYLPKLGLTFSTSVQSMWYTKHSTFPRNSVPVAYIDASGVQRPYTEADRKDAILQWLVLKESSVTNSKVPISLIVNFKANKQLGKYINLSLFVNQILDYMPDYEVNGLINKRTVSPYFGMELNIKI